MSDQNNHKSGAIFIFISNLATLRAKVNYNFNRFISQLNH